MLNYILTIIDAQYAFKASRRVRSNILKRIKEANVNNAPIVFIEYSGAGKTMPSLIKACSSYEVIIKCEDDGSSNLINPLSKYKCKNLLICGVNTSACVYSTIQGLLNKTKYNIMVAEDSCNCCYKIDHEETIKFLKRKKRIKII
jgi:hypothetical protein